jgi:hypothetical protein
MSRKHIARAALIASLTMNVALMAAIIIGTQYVRRQSLDQAAMVAESQSRLLAHIRDEIESGDPQRLERLRASLDRWIADGLSAAEAWRAGR